VSKAGFLGAGPYKVPNVRIRSRGIFSHTPPTTAFRGFGSTHFCWAIESQVDEAARRLFMDPVKIRLQNLPKKGEILVPGDNPVDGDWAEALVKAAEAVDWDSPAGPERGRGVAIGIKSSVPATVAKARASVHSDGSVTVCVGSTEMGQGLRNTMAKIVSDQLGIPLDRIHVVSGDTGFVPLDTITASSRSTVMMGNALVAACNQIKEQLREIAGAFLEVNPQSIALSEGEATAGGARLSYEHLMEKRFGRYLGELTGEGLYEGDRDPSHPLGGPSAFWEVIFSTTELEVDRETGQVTIQKLVNISDVGKVINRIRAVGMDEGCSLMGMGAARLEEVLFDETGRMLNANSLDYRVPTAADIPRHLESLFQEKADGPGPYGSKGIGESGILAVAPALCNAIRDCTGIRFYTLPLTSERIWRALRTSNDTS
jgi:CO/xanthine dehydrogenase Mo-binding subunit